MDYSLRNHASFIGSKVQDLPTPALVVSKPTVKSNIAQLHRDVETVGVRFRPHVKTLKSLEVTRLMLGEGKHRGIVCSTLAEVEGVTPLVKEGVLDEALYGVPVAPSKLPRLSALRSSIRVLLMIDNIQQLEAIEAFQASNPPASQEQWPIFIKVDVGYGRAGVPVSSPRLEALVRRAQECKVVNILGFYAHAGQSYHGRSEDAAESFLAAEMQGVLDGAKLLGSDREVLVSIGSTPTAHVVKSLKANAPKNVTIELHAGNFPCNDLQQVSTGVVDYSQQAIRLLVEVCSTYPERNEALVNAGTIAISKETSTYAGFGQVVGKPGWYVKRTAQEHGILGYDTPSGAPQGTAPEAVEDVFRVGDKVLLHVSHACITASNHHAYFIVDENDVVQETWVPWKGW